jgi:hypothetical protein
MTWRILSRMKISRSTTFRVCAVCKTPRKVKDQELVPPCKRCGSPEPLEVLVVSDERSGFMRTSRIRKIVLREASRVSKLVGVPLGDLLRQMTASDQDASHYAEDWFSQVFLDNTYAGVTLMDVVYDPPKELVDSVVRKKMMQVRVPDDLHKWFKRYAHDNDSTMSAIVIRFIQRLKVHNTRTVEPEQI